MYKCKHVLAFQTSAFCYFRITEKQDLISQEVKYHALLQNFHLQYLFHFLLQIKILFTQMKSRPKDEKENQAFLLVSGFV